MNIFKRPMFLAGLACSMVTAVSLYYKTLSLFLVIVFLSFLLFLIFRRNYKYITVMIAVIAFSMNLFAEFGKLDTISMFDKQKVSGKFMVVSEPIQHDRYNILTLKSVDCKNLPDNTNYLVFDNSKLDLCTGEILVADILVTAIDAADEYSHYDYGNDVYATASILDCKSTGSYNYLYKTVQIVRTYIKDTVSAHSDADSAGLLVALTTGDRSLLSDNFLDNVKTTGISHVIVVSGMHLSIIMSAVFFVLDRFFTNKYIRSLLSVLIVLVISSVCGFTMSVIRAGVMFVIAGFAPVFNRDNDPLNSLLTAVTTVLVVTPFAIFNISFQLSVLSTLAIIWVSPFYHKIIVMRFSVTSKVIKTILNIVLCSVFAMIFTLPITIKAFGYISIVAPVTNLAVTYPITAALVINIFAVIISAIPYLSIISNLLFALADLLSRFIVACVDKLADLPITIAILPNTAFWFSLAVIAAIIAFMYTSQYKTFKRNEVIKCQ